jgi:hypothetical protein
MKNLIRSGLFILLLAPVFFYGEAFADDEVGSAQFRDELEAIKTRLANVERQQKEILDKDDLILEKLDQLRVWVHRK